MRCFKTPLARRLFWIVFWAVIGLVFCVIPLAEILSTHHTAMKAVAEARTDASFETIDTLVDAVRDVTRHNWETIAFVSAAGIILATVLALIVCRPVEGAQEKVRDLIHDLRGPISGMLNDAQIAIDTKDDLMKALVSIKAKAESVLATYDLNAEIVRNYAGIDKGKVADVDLTAIVEDYAELFGGTAEAKGVEFIVSRPCDAVVVRAHEDKMRRLVANLVENAVKYTDKGKVCVGLAVKKSKFVLTVADTGVGMTENEKRLMCNEYYRAKRSRGKPGIGHGLAMVGSIMQFYGSEPKCDSKPGKGTTFTVTLPLDLTPRKNIIRHTFGLCGGWARKVYSLVRKTHHSAPKKQRIKGNQQ